MPGKTKFRKAALRNEATRHLGGYASASPDMKAFIRLAESYVRRATATPETARAALIETGVYEADGQLSKRYR